MWKPFAFAGLVALSAGTQAHGINFNISDDAQCHAEVNHAVRVGPRFIDARKDHGDVGSLFYYDASGQLVVAGEEVALDERQQVLLQQYRSQLHEAGRELTLISLEAVDLALRGVSIALTVLAGSDHPDTLEIQQTSAEILQRAEDHLNQNGEVYTFGDPEIDEFIEQVISEEFEPRIEQVAKDSAGTIAWHALKAVFTGGRSIEREAEEMAEGIERDVEQQAERLEERANGLCDLLKEIDGTEQQLHAAIPALGAYDLVNME